MRLGTLALAVGSALVVCLWRSESRREYIWAAYTQIEAVAMGRSTGEALTIRPGPLSTFT